MKPKGRRASAKPESAGKPPKNTAKSPASEIKGLTAKQTDLSNAEKLIALHGDNLKYVREWGKWLVWDGRRWAIDDRDSRVHRLAVNTVRVLMREAVIGVKRARDEGGDAKEAAFALKWAKESQSASRIRALIEIARSDETVNISHKKLDANTWQLNVRNGTIDLKTGKLSRHQQHHLITKLAPVDFKPEQKTPHWEAFLAKVTANNAGLKSYMQKSIGYSLTGSIEEHVLIFHHGDGGRGKSTFLNLFHEMLGDYSWKAPRKLLFTSKNERHPTELASLHGRRFVTCSEIEKGKTFDEALVKDLTGGDPIAARRMREDFWDFLPTHKFMLAGNYKPRVRGDDEGIWRRIKLVPWDVAISKKEKDPKLPAKLKAEWGGILAWAVLGCRLWQKEGLTTPGVVERATSAYRAESDQLGEFFALWCVFSEPGAKVSRSKLRKAYESYCEDSGERPVSPKEIAASLNVRGVTRTTVWDEGGTRDGWKGVRLKTTAERKEEVAEPVTGVGRKRPNGLLTRSNGVVLPFYSGKTSKQT